MISKVRSKWAHRKSGQGCIATRETAPYRLGTSLSVEYFAKVFHADRGVKSALQSCHDFDTSGNQVRSGVDDAPDNRAGWPHMVLNIIRDESRGVRS